MKNKLNSISSNNGRFHDGDPATGKLGTIVTASWLNDVQDRLQDTFDELNNLLGLASLTPIPAKKNQLAEAITALLDKKVSLGSNETITGEKTFTRKLFALGGLRLSSSQGNANNGHYAEWFADANTVWMTFKGHTYRWHTDGRVSVDNKKFYSELHKPRFADLLDIPTTLSGYGISNFKVETFNGDINTLRTDGHFCISSAANSRNLPVQASGNLQVIAGGVGNERYCHQVFRRHYSREIYGRYQVSGSNDNWSEWSRLDGVDWNDVRNRPTQGAASTSQRGDVLLTNDTGLDSENLAFSAKGAKKLSQEIAQNRQKTVELANQKINKSEISDAVNSDSRTNVASSKAVKTAYDKGQAALELAGRKQSPQTTLHGYGITDAVKLQDMRERNGSVSFDDATPAQLPYGSFVGLSSKASLQNQGANGWKFISKGWGDASGVYACVRFGITGNRFYFQTARDYQNWNSPLELLAENILVGAVLYFATSTAPSGWLKANGAAVSRTTYANLFARIGTTFGVGDGRTTFNLPDLRGEFIRGWNDGRNVDSGRGFGSQQGDAIRNITGQFNAYRRTDKTQLVMPSGVFSNQKLQDGSMGRGGSDNWAMTINFDASRVVPTANENRPRNIALLACIKY